MNTRHQPAAPAPLPHTLLEDAAAIFTGVLMISVGVALFKQAGLVTGGMAGLAFSLHYATHIGFGVWFFVLNLPFYWLAVRKMGWAFTVKTFCAVGLLAVASELQPLFLSLERVQAPYAAVVGGILMGVGMLVLFRHRCSLGGVGIAALFLQERYGWRAGYVQMGLDCLILLSAFFIVDVERALWSILAALTLNQVLSMNHRPGRYGG
ncbi:YitT family protein [Comamonas aquatica]|uniref:YitT family protein n=1 Tax=Comamonas aquatica TaxID=225991 RepID=UPI00244C6B98|nr:YitT family protein [Comamonas aquatica]MDH0201509.1 YitT family protein [Comamonas aquatica]MDH0382403.1 YitT family protein [Comamonas aquatica]MDH0430554.1 YitT family protein [Comamonas aquatica]MDH0942707.1 YitT family protein [Comamonas aquatica]MDH1380187.1 YitT family protein [Comamonas aquatica]